MKFRHLFFVFSIFGMLICTSCDKDDKTEWEVSEYNDIDVPFAVIEKSPVYPGCENAQDKKECLQDNISTFVNENFDASIANDLGLAPGKKRINVLFKISYEGKIVDVRARGPHVDLENEAIRVVNKLPKMKPGIQREARVNVTYALPIIVNVD